MEVLSNGAASCASRSDCTMIDTADKCFVAAQAQGIGSGGYSNVLERAESQPGCFLFNGELVEFNADLAATGVWSQVAPICWCTGQEPTWGGNPLAESLMFGASGVGFTPFVVGFFFIIWNAGAGRLLATPLVEYVAGGARDRRDLCQALRACVRACFLPPHVAQVTHSGPTLSTVAQPLAIQRPNAPGLGLA